MNLPIFKNRRSKELEVSDLFGGLNLRDSVSDVNNNQLTDSFNMWQSDGMLKTRPGTKSSTLFEIPNRGMSFKGEDIKKHNVFKNGIKGEMQLFSAPCKRDDVNGFIQIYMFFVGKDELEQLPVLKFSESKAIDSYFITESKDKLYFYTNDQEIYILETNADDVSGWVKLKEEEYYAPLVLVHCTSQLGASSSKNHVMASGTQLEGYNIISPYYRMSYSLYDEVNAKESTNSEGKTYKYCNAIFDLIVPVSVSAYSGKKLKLEYTDVTGTHKHEITLNGTNTDQFSDADKNELKLQVKGRYVQLVNESGSVAEFSEGSGRDNVIITAPMLTFDDNGVKSLKEDKKRVFSMTQSIWYGGDSSGLDGGTRLFLCNNRNKKLKGLVSWSGLNDPTYFPENSYFYVGDNNERVTCFGKAQDMLVIFKERETWFTKYMRNTNITAESVINQSVIDYSASSVYFPLTQINPNIGCPYPETVQLCRNRLVWLGYYGAVHTLVTNNQYNERNIYTVSEMVQRKLKDEDGTKAFSADWNGYYCLSFGGRMYLMDYNCYGYNYISSYSKTEDANKLIPWYYWELCSAEYSCKTPLACIGDNLMFIKYRQEASVLNDCVEKFVFDEELDRDDETNILSTFTTKLFEFGAPHLRKNIDRVNLQLGNNKGAIIFINFLTEGGVETQAVQLIGDEEANYAPNFVESKALFPCIRNVSRFGLKLICEGKISLEGAIIKYKYTGGCR